jgi:NADH-quinone oxidoreductase subunit C
VSQTTAPSGLLGQALTEKSAQLITLLQGKLGSQILSSSVELGDAVIKIPAQGALQFFQLLKLDSELQFNLLVDVTAVDWLDSQDDRFQVVYQLLSLVTKFRLRVLIDLPEAQPEVDSIVSLWPGANYLEREVWDMYGIKFRGHPELKRILMYEEFDGHPLRKDYPVQGKQPRIPLRAAEVRNTALDMARPALVGINPRKK